MKESCETCRYWQAATAFCRRHAPRATPRKILEREGHDPILIVDTYFPVVRPEQWCGEYGERDPDGMRPVTESLETKAAAGSA